MKPDDITPDALLRAARRERPPADARDRLLATLGVAGATGGVSAFLAKLGPKLGIASLAIGITAGAAHWMMSHPEPAPAVPPAPAVVVAGPSQPVAPTDPIAEPAIPVSELPTAAPEKKPALQASAPVNHAPSLSREVELVTNAQQSLARGDPRSALRALDAHDREFPSGALLPESQTLRIEALVGLDDPHARSLAEAFLAAHPTGPQSRRVRAAMEPKSN